MGLVLAYLRDVSRWRSTALPNDVDGRNSKRRVILRSSRINQYCQITVEIGKLIKTYRMKRCCVREASPLGIRADRTNSASDNSQTFLMTNMMPQTPDNNRHTWEGLEKYCCQLAKHG